MLLAQAAAGEHERGVPRLGRARNTPRPLPTPLGEPDVSTVARFGSSRTARQAARTSAALSTARWKVQGSGETAWISASVASLSTDPSSDRKPKTKPAAPASASSLTWPRSRSSSSGSR